MGTSQQIYAGTVVLADFEPGDMTRYELALVRPAEVADGRVLFAWTNAPGGGKSMRLPGGSSLSVGYIAEKMGVRARDAAVLCRWLASHGVSAQVQP